MINLSIIIPIYKESRNIQKLAKNITNYIDIKNYEILFIDDNSNDGKAVEVLTYINSGFCKILGIYLAISNMGEVMNLE